MKVRRITIEDQAFTAAHREWKRAVAGGMSGVDAFAWATEVYTHVKNLLKADPTGRREGAPRW